MASQISKNILPNGIPVFSQRMSNTNVVTLLIFFKVGSRYETLKLNGVSHFIEHLFFKGTKKRPSTLAISQELDGVGADYNAFTSKDYTGYYIKVASHHTALALDVLADMLFHPLFEEREIERERGVIVEEINMYEDNPMATVEEVLEEVFFGESHPLGYRIAGTKQNILKMSRTEIIQFRNNYYHNTNIKVIITGNFPKNIIQLLKKNFLDAPKKIPPQKAESFYYKQAKPRLKLQKKDTAQTHLALAFPAPSYTSPSLPTAEVLSIILGGNMSSRLFINVRDKKGLCYYISSHINPYEEIGTLRINAGFDTKRLIEAIRAIKEELEKISHDPVAADELTKAKEFVRGKMYLALEDSEQVAAWWGKQALFNKKYDTPEEYLKKIFKVTIKDLQKFAAKTFNKQKTNCAIIGPYTEKDRQLLLRACL